MSDENESVCGLDEFGIPAPLLHAVGVGLKQRGVDVWGKCGLIKEWILLALPILEDYDLVRRLRRHGRVVTCAQAATTSGRRWQRSGLLRVTLKNQLIIAGFHLGVAPHKLAHFYRT